MKLHRLTRREFQAALLSASCGGWLASRTEAPGQDSQRNDEVIGPGGSLRGFQVFPPDNPWNEDISARPVDALSGRILQTIGLDKPLHPDFGTTYQGKPSGIPYVVVRGTQPRVPVKFDYPDESDPGPYPIPPDAPIEGGADSRGDRHILVIDRDSRRLYELFASRRARDGNGWEAGSGAIFDLNSNRLRPLGWTSADAAGLPIFPGLVRHDEVATQGAVRHAFRFTVRRSRRAYVHPARHFASKATDVALPPMGMRVRLKASYDTQKYPPQARVILEALKSHGMILADNGGDWFLSGAPDPKWDDEDLATLKRVKVRDFEVVTMGDVVTR
jgi:hypothetical protein